MTGYGVFKRRGEPARVGFRTPDGILDLSPLGAPFTAASLNPLLAQGRAGWARAWEQVQSLRARGGYVVAEHEARAPTAVHGRRLRRLLLVARARDQPGAAVPARRRAAAAELAPPPGRLPRAGGTVVVSGTPVVRPSGQRKAPDGPGAVVRPHAPSRHRARARLRRRASRAGSASRSRRSRFRDHVFGVVLVNDWSARDIQAWEYQPLGPFLGKSFATSIAAWVTPLDALEHAWVPRARAGSRSRCRTSARRATGTSTSTSRWS